MTEQHEETSAIKPEKRTTLLRWLGWFAFINGCLASLIALRYIAYMGPLDGLVGALYLPLTMFSHFTLLALLLTLVLLPLALLWPRFLPVATLGVVLAGTAIVILIIDTFVYSQYRFHLNGFVLALIWDAGDEIFDFSWFTWLSGIAIAALVVLLEAIIARIAIRRARQSAPRPRYGYYAAAAFMLALLASQVTHAVADALYVRSITSLSRHLPIYRPATAKSMLHKHFGVEIQSRHRRLRVASREGNLDYPKAPLRCQTPDERLNLIWIILDSWRFDAVGEAVVPNIDAFIRRHPVADFQQHYSGGNGTRPGIFSLFYAMPASYWPAFYGEQLAPVLMQQLAAAGYEFGIFASAKLTRPSFDRTVFSDLSDLRLNSDGRNAWQRDQDIVADWLAFTAARDPGRPLFGFLFFDAPHAYTYPPDYPQQFEPLLERIDHMALDNDYDPLPYHNRYRQSVHFTDSLVGQVLDDLERRDMVASSIIVISSDHGQEFNETGQNYWGHGSNYSRYQAQVPLYIHWPGKGAATYSHMSSHLDIAPTLMRDLLGCTNPLEQLGTGRDLWDTSPRGSVVVSGYLEYGIIEPDRTTVLYQKGDFDVYDPDYTPSNDLTLSPEVSTVVLESMSRFYR